MLQLSIQDQEVERDGKDRAGKGESGKETSSFTTREGQKMKLTQTPKIEQLSAKLIHYEIKIR